MNGQGARAQLSKGRDNSGPNRAVLIGDVIYLCRYDLLVGAFFAVCMFDDVYFLFQRYRIYLSFVRLRLLCACR